MTTEMTRILKPNKKSIKAQKQEICNNGALEVGFNNDVLKAFTVDEILLAVQDLAADGLLAGVIDEFTLDCIIVNRVVMSMRYHRFKEVANYFYNYHEMIRTYSYNNKTEGVEL